MSKAEILSFNDDFMKWFYSEYELDNFRTEKKSFVQLKTVYNNFMTQSKLYLKLSKIERRTYNRKYIINMVINDEKLKTHYVKKLYYNKGCSCYTHCLMNFHKKYLYMR
jgi:hypothetical protein